MTDAFATIPDPGRAHSLDELASALRSLKVWAGDPSYEWITTEINDAWTAAGRTAALDQLRRTLHRRTADGRAVVISAIAGMAGVGKTQLAIHAGHVLTAEEPFDRVLFVNLRGFHPDPAQPPADPAAVLDGFLRLLGVPGQQIPHDMAARTAAYRGRLAGTHTLVVLDNAADADHVRPLLPQTPRCPVLV